MKRYIFITFDIHMMGGCQNYLSGKTDYLIRKGWDVFVLYPGTKSSKSCPFEQLKRFENGGISLIKYLPAELPGFFRKKIFSEIDAVVNESTNYECTVIESHDDKSCLWGELLANRYSAKHVNFNCNEQFRGTNKYYEEYIELFYYKYLRGELYTITKQAMVDLFSGHYCIDVLDKDVFVAACPDSVQDCENNCIDSIGKADWSLAYIGRIQKNYVDRILTDVSIFAKQHSDKHINMIFVGDTSSKDLYINNLFASIKNVVVYRLGDMVPIPRKLYSKLDVVIAGAGCADCSVKEGVPVIVPDPKTTLANGILGYETQSILFHDGKSLQSSYDKALSRVLIEKEYVEKPFTYVFDKEPSFFYNQQLQIVESKESNKNYFSTRKIVSSNGHYLSRIKNSIRFTLRAFIRN